MIPEAYQNIKSYSRLRGISWDYKLSDEYFCFDFGTYIVCTDTEADIDYDANIVLATKSGLVLHIGKFPVVKNDNYKARIDGTKLVIDYVPFSRHRDEVPHIEIDIQLTQERLIKMHIVNCARYLKARGLVGYKGGSFRNELDINVNTDKNYIVLNGTYRRRSGYAEEKKSYAQYIVYEPTQGFVLLPDNNGEDPILSYVIRKRGLMTYLNEYNLKLGLGKPVRFFVSSRNLTICSIYDIKDGTTELIDTSRIEQAVLDGDVQVVGLDYINGVFYYRQVDEYR